MYIMGGMGGIHKPPPPRWDEALSASEEDEDNATTPNLLNLLFFFRMEMLWLRIRASIHPRRMQTIEHLLDARRVGYIEDAYALLFLWYALL